MIASSWFGKETLLQLNLSASSLELLLDLVSLSLRSSLLDGLRSGVNLLLSFLQAQAGDLANSLDNVDLGRASVNQNYVEVGLSVSSSCAVAACYSTCNSYRRSDTPNSSSRAFTSSESSITLSSFTASIISATVMGLNLQF